MSHPTTPEPPPPGDGPAGIGHPGAGDPGAGDPGAGGYQPPTMGMPAYGPPMRPPGGGSGGTIIASVLSVLVVIGSVVGAVVANSSDSGQVATSTPTLANGSLSRSGVAPQPVPSLTTSTSAYSPPAPPTPTHVPLNPQAVNRTFELYMDALLDHNMYSLRSATCPRLRSTLKGFALHGKYLRRWKGLPYTIYSSLDYVRLSAKVYFASPYSGTAIYDWYVERTSAGDYYVCGFLS